MPTTIVDDGASLIGLAARGVHRPSTLLAGQLLAVAALTGSAVVVARTSVSLPHAMPHLPGVLPIPIGR